MRMDTEESEKFVGIDAAADWESVTLDSVRGGGPQSAVQPSAENRLYLSQLKKLDQPQNRDTKLLSPPFKSGNLYKYSPALLKRWQRRYVEVKDGILTYYERSMDGL